MHYLIFSIFFNKITVLILYLILLIISIKYYLIIKEKKYLENYSSTLEKSTIDLKRFKHDYLNIISTLESLINSGNIKELKEYYNKELLPVTNKIAVQNTSIFFLKNLKIIPLRSLMLNKIRYAQANSIDITFEIIDEIDSVNIKILDLCRIIGILMDNAIESSMQSEKKYVHLAIVNATSSIVFIIVNSCSENCPPVYKLYEKNFSTKGANRGLGLNTVQKLLSSYSNILSNTTVNNYIFKQEIIIYNN